MTTHTASGATDDPNAMRMQCEIFRAITMPGSEGEWGMGSWERGMGKGAPYTLALPAP